MHERRILVSKERTIMVFHHHYRQPAIVAAASVRGYLENAGITVVDRTSTEPIELIIVLGGDGTILEAANIAHRQGVPVIGVNLGHVGFLAEAEEEELGELCERVVRGEYQVERRMCIDVEVRHPDGSVQSEWAANDIAVLSTDKGHPALLAFGVDGEAVSEYGADGLIVSTPTGSTAYNFSVGGPVVWPDVQALVLSPLAAHGLFTRSLVLGPSSVLEIQVLPQQVQDCEVWADGRRILPAPLGSSIRVTKSTTDMQLARLVSLPFSARLVKKFGLPVEGWRGR
ncbi:NAD kinase [Mobiluncus curtisii]|nr:NAD kinase [Mobiluncus curtisii]EFL94627.1 NAD(+)/NADH kinase [Mobiluncus curtisii subsp. curtisii ATCC 35241]MCU9987741.1 NAD kinase [Mobiluncus curtisii]MCV0000883.1 NAD kinase [Mobiluncus curtisii]MCV0020885.1 NAD kinase [Mobiluncus curtisii]NMW46263.1 NAD kinase [Mobiluncus curtisii]